MFFPSGVSLIKRPYPVREKPGAIAGGTIADVSYCAEQGWPVCLSEGNVFHELADLTLDGAIWRGVRKLDPAFHLEFTSIYKQPSLRNRCHCLIGIV
jgi:hypothetical protein